MLERITGKHIAEKMLFGGMHIEVANMRGQSYDGAPNMSSEYVGVQKGSENMLHSHVVICGHIFNLVIVHSCKLPSIRNMIDKMKSVCLHFNNIPKREVLLKAIISSEIPDANQRKPLLNSCVTRWAARHESYQHFYQAFVFMVKAFEVIAYGMHGEMEGLELYMAGWDSDSKKEALPLLQCITAFDFIINFIMLYMTLALLLGISKSFQEKDLDILSAHQKVIILQTI